MECPTEMTTFSFRCYSAGEKKIRVDAVGSLADTLLLSGQTRRSESVRQSAKKRGAWLPAVPGWL